ncbi:MAG: 5-(carboxyamino)imidazole ribonucleotide synthase [Chloroflexota bacterium]|nr:5-(carboxyamino)imidazole ribonucleotide synthase [Chloroflexota bacterium]
MSDLILPGATIGVLGSGQLGRMLALAARRMGYRIHTLSPDRDSPTGQVADREVVAAYDDLDAVREFARGVQVVTFEFENVPAASAAVAAEYAPVRPAGSVLHTTQHRLREKTFLHGVGLPVTPFRRVTSAGALADALADLGTPALLKTAGFGYDGKGQVRINAPGEAAAAWGALGTGEAVLEAWVDFAREVSVVAARGVDGAFVAYPVIENRHRHGILDVSRIPAGLPPLLAAQVVEIARTVLTRLEVVGVLCVEFFVTHDGQLLINELAPRPHNSGHLTIEACVTDQFEQQLRAVCGLPLGAPDLIRPAAMANLLGDGWARGAPDWVGLAADFPAVKLHLYGKAAARPGRKMGHLTSLAATPEDAAAQVAAARSRLFSSNATILRR